MSNMTNIICGVGSSSLSRALDCDAICVDQMLISILCVANFCLSFSFWPRHCFFFSGKNNHSNLCYRRANVKCKKHSFVNVQMLQLMNDLLIIFFFFYKFENYFVSFTMFTVIDRKYISCLVYYKNIIWL